MYLIPGRIIQVLAKNHFNVDDIGNIDEKLMFVSSKVFPQIFSLSQVAVCKLVVLPCHIFENFYF